MYLTRRVWVGAEERRHMHLTGLGDLVDPARVCAIVEDIGSWRKANAIHRWFVTNAQDGQDDGRTAEVSPFQLKEWLGHARLDTTSIYVHMAKQNAKKVMEATSL